MALDTLVIQILQNVVSRRVSHPSYDHVPSVLESFDIVAFHNHLCKVMPIIHSVGRAVGTIVVNYEP